MSAATLQVPLARRSVNLWLIAFAVVIPTFMEVLDTTIANVSLRYIAGGLSAANVDSEWVITTYLASNAIVLPISGWLALLLGRRNYFLLSIAIFTLASALCGMAGSLGFIIASRAIQGVAGGGLQPSSQAVLLDAFPQEKQGQAMTIFGMAALLAPVVGPTLGGFITDNYGWRWIFYLNVPVGLLAYLMCHALVEDPEYLQVERAKNRNRREPFDVLGLCLLSVTMVCWEIMLSKGQEWDWLGDPFYRVQVLLILFILGLGGFDLSRIAAAQSAGRAPDDGRPKLWHLLRHYLLRLRSALRQHHFASCFAAVPFWLRRNHFGFGSIAIRNLRDHHAGCRRRSAISRSRCPLSNGRWSNHDGPWKLLDGTPQSRCQSVAGGLAESGGDRGTFDAIRAT
jgi:MFS family permease